MNPWLILLLALIGVYFFLRVVACLCSEPASINDENPYLHADKIDVLPEDMRGVQFPVKPERKVGFYELYGKRSLDSLLSFSGLLVLSPFFLVLFLWIKIDDPGPVFFVQKRVGKGKSFFALHKFRTMKTSTPHDIPTHMLTDPDAYLTKAGRFLRKSSLDELPQIWDIFRGKMGIIGPRPALWNQADLVAEREKYAANDMIPGLTGWAQINGRDELEIVDKARLDGDYSNNVSLRMDIKCFFGTFKSVLKSDGVVEGGTGEIKRRDVTAGGANE